MTLSQPLGSSVQTAPEWWRSAVVYQIYPRSFVDGNGDGIGDLRGIRSRLDHLQRLGVDVIWLSPIYRSPQADNGYDISDYQDIDPLFGTMDEFHELLGDVHARGMKLVMDLVVNHTSDEHPWFVESRSSTDSPRRDWYWWRPARDGFAAGEKGAEPTNWESFFSGSTWQLDERTGEYYLHLFDRKQPDLNWENPEVRQAVYAMRRWWLELGVDGFRMDVINLISKDVALPDGVADPVTGLGDGFAHYAHGPRLHEFLQEMHREVFEGRGDLITVGEMPGVTTDEALLLTDPARDELDMVFQFEHVGLDHGADKFHPVPIAPGRLAESLTRWQDALGAKGWNSLYLSNHDQPRAVSRFGDDAAHWRASATALATMLHLLRGTPYIYQGEEIGMTNMPFAGIDDLRDVESINHYAKATELGQVAAEVLDGIRHSGRDNARTPVQWDASAEAGFTTGTPWIAVNPNHAWLNAAAQYDDPDSVFAYYRRLIALRHARPVVALGSFRRLELGGVGVFAYEREHEGDRLLVLANLSGTPSTIELPEEWADAEQVLDNLGAASDAAVLRPWEARVLAR